VLNDLVISTTGTTANNLAVTITLERQGILTNGIPPYILNSAGTKTMHTLALIFTNDGVLEGGSVSEKEHCIRVSAFGLATAFDAAAVRLETAVKGSRDGFGGLVGDGAFAGGDREAAGVAGTEGTGSLGYGEGEEGHED
jgi:hypothetical protein